MKNPEKNTTATMNTAPAVMPTHARAWNSLLGRPRSGTVALDRPWRRGVGGQRRGGLRFSCLGHDFDDADAG